MHLIDITLQQAERCAYVFFKRQPLDYFYNFNLKKKLNQHTGQRAKIFTQIRNKSHHHLLNVSVSGALATLTPYLIDGYIAGGPYEDS